MGRNKTNMTNLDLETRQERMKKAAWEEMEANRSDIPKCLRRPLMKSGYCRPEVDLRWEAAKDEIIRGLLAFLAILAIGVFLIAL